MSKTKDLTGQRFGKLIVSHRDGSNKHGRAIWSCNCDCGKINHKSTSNDLLKGDTTSCGCNHLSGNSNRKHSLCKTKGYWIFVSMKERCYNPNSQYYYLYGERGIKICEHWLESVANFYQDMGPKPGPEYSIDRIDNNGDYSPENCRWATSLEQGANKRNNVFLEFNNKRMTIAQWSRELNISKSVIRTRLKYGWTAEEIFTTPIGEKRKSNIERF